MSEQQDRREVIIVGAGLAGLAAARELRQRGFGVQVLEGRKRLGGRLQTDDSLGMPVDLGASWVQGSVDNPIALLARQLGLRSVARTLRRGPVFGPDGQRIPRSELEASAAELSRVRQQMARIAAATEVDLSVSRALADATDGHPLSRGARSMLYADVVLTCGVDLERLSLLYVADDEDFGGESLLLPGGFQQVAEALAEGLDVRLGDPVASISWQGPGADVETAAGERYQADHVVVTLPLGVLKARHVEFSPPLPEAKLAAIDRLGVGVVDKLILTFPEPFWDADAEFFSVHAAELGRMPEFMNLGGQATRSGLMGFVAGDVALRLEQLSERAVRAEALDVLRGVYGPGVPEPDGFRFTRWGSDAMSLGTSCTVLVGGSSADFDTLAEPLEDRVFFAGEATHRRYRATVHGAYLSGLREAERIDSL